MSMYIYKDQQRSGPYHEADVAEWLRSGQLSGSDMACRSDSGEWRPLSETFPFVGNDQRTASISPAVEWARNSFVQPIDVVGIYDSIIYRILLGLVLLGPPTLLVALGGVLLVLAGEPWVLILGILLLVFMCVLFGTICLLFYAKKQVRIKHVDSQGVTNGRGDRFLWADLEYVASHSGRRPNLNYTYRQDVGLVAGMLIRMTFGLLNRGTTIEFRFTNGKAFLPSRIRQGQEIQSLMNTVPVEHR